LFYGRVATQRFRKETLVIKITQTGSILILETVSLTILIMFQVFIVLILLAYEIRADIDGLWAIMGNTCYDCEIVIRF
jgi:hypothetical protein